MLPLNPMLYSDALCIAPVFEQHLQHSFESPDNIPDLLCHTTYPPLPATTTRHVPPSQPAKTIIPAPPAQSITTTRPVPQSQPAKTPATSTRLAITRHTTPPQLPTTTAKQTKYKRLQVRHKFARDGTPFVQGKKDPLSNMWHGDMVWQDLIFHSSEHFAVNSFQETTLAPISQKDNTLRYPANGFEGRTSPTVNIHHNNRGHWVCSFLFENDDSLYLLDSNLGRNVEKCLTDSLKNQLS